MRFYSSWMLILTLCLGFFTQAQAGDPKPMMPLRLSVSIPLGGSSKSGEVPSCDVSLAKVSEKPTFWDELLGVAEASLIFSALDFLYFNGLNPNKQSLGYYRAFQGILQTSLSVWLFYRFGGPKQWREGLKVAGSFNLMWWTGNDDLIYYGIGELFGENNYRRMAHAGGFMNDSDPNGWAMQHFWWTPLGLGQLMTGTPKDQIHFTREAVLGQAAVGLIGAVSLLAFDFWQDEKSKSDGLTQEIKKISERQNALRSQGLCAGSSPAVQSTISEVGIFRSVGSDQNVAVPSALLIK